jgi:hypothetical protein
MAHQFFCCMDGRMTFADGEAWFRISIKRGGAG